MSAPPLSEVELRGLIEAVRQVPVAVTLVDASGGVIYANDRAHEMAEEVLGGTVPTVVAAGFDRFHVDGRRYAYEEWPVMRTIQSGETVVDEEFFHVRPDGKRVYVRCSSSPIAGPGGSTIAAVVVTVDVTAEKEAEERLSYFDRLLENTDDAIVGTDADFRVTVWSAGAERLYGYPADEALGRYAREVATFEGDQSRTELEGDLLGSGRTRTEFRALRKDGTPVEVELIAVAVRNDDGEIAGYLGIQRDISGRKTAEREQEQLVAIVRYSADFVGIATMDGVPTFLNEAGRRMVCFGDRDVTKTHVLDYFAKEDRDYVRDVLLPLIADSGRWPAETELRMRNWDTEESIPVLFDAFRIDDPRTGEPMAIATVTRDISERKRAEEEREARARRQATIAALGLRALGDEDVGGLIDQAVEFVAETLGVRYASVAELVGGDHLVLRAGTGWPREAIGTTWGSAGRETFAGYTLMVKEPVVSDDVASDERFPASAVLDTSGPTSAAGVVIHGRDEPFGVLTVFSEGTRPVSANDLDFLQTVANLLAIAIERVEAEERLDEIRDDERRRIARSLHDDALQELAVAIARSHATPGAAQIEAALEGVGQEIRSAIYDLRLGDEQHRSFPELLRALVGVHSGSSVDCEIELVIEEGAPEGSLGSTGVEVIRILGEALTNVRRHSGARHARVRVSGSGLRLCAEVTDDGRGIDLQSGAGGTGITGMRERAALIGADLHVHSSPRGGTTVRLELPLVTGAAPAENETRVLLVEDHIAVREALAAAFEREPDIRVAGQAGTLAEARELLADVDVAILDLGLPDGAGTDLIADLQKVSPTAQAIILSAALDRAEAARAVGRGAAGVLPKMAGLHEVVAAVRKLRAGEALMPVGEVSDLLRFAEREQRAEQRERALIGELTRRELEVLQLLADGLNSQDMADRLHISLRTQRNHVANILQKLDVHSQLQALVFALRYGVVEIPSRRVD
jgi:PAS domain S-box-containing protein